MAPTNNKSCYRTPTKKKKRVRVTTPAQKARAALLKKEARDAQTPEEKQIRRDKDSLHKRINRVKPKLETFFISRYQNNMNPNNLTHQQWMEQRQMDLQIQNARNVQAGHDSQAAQAIAQAAETQSKASAQTLVPLSRKYGLVDDSIPPVVSSSSSSSGASSFTGNTGNAPSGGMGNATGNTASTGNVDSGNISTSKVKIETNTLPPGFPIKWVINDEAQYRALMGEVWNSLYPILRSEPTKAALLLACFIAWAANDSNKAYLLQVAEEFRKMLNWFLERAKGSPTDVSKEEAVGWISTTFVPKYKQFLTRPDRKVVVFLDDSKLHHGISKSYDKLSNKLLMDGDKGVKVSLRYTLLHTDDVTDPAFPIVL